MLEQVAHYNDFSPKLRNILEQKIKAFGKKVRYRFDIEKDNPDPEKYNGPKVWPTMHVLDPITFQIVDPHEDRKDKQKVKQVGMVKKVNEKGLPESFDRVRVHGRDKGIVTYELDNPDHVKAVVYLELHPKLVDGMFANKDAHKYIRRIDEVKNAEENRKLRKDKALAYATLVEMTEEKVIEFARAMQWDDTEDPGVLRDKIEEMAEKAPEMFNDLTKTKKLEYLANIKLAIDKAVVSVDPIEGRWTWSKTGDLIAVVGKGADGNEYHKFADFLMTAGAEVYKKVKDLL